MGREKAAQVGNPVHLTAQAANISTATAFAVPASGAGLYRVSAYIAISQIASTTSVMPSVTIGWTDPNGQAQTLAASATKADNALTDFAGSVTVVNAAPSTNITYATGSYASTGTTPMQYELDVRVEAMG